MQSGSLTSRPTSVSPSTTRTDVLPHLRLDKALVPPAGCRELPNFALLGLLVLDNGKLPVRPFTVVY